MAKEDKKRVMLNLSHELHDRVEKMAEIMEIDVSAFIRLAIREKLEREEAKEGK